MDKVVVRIEENRNLIQTTSATVASMGLDKIGQKVAGVMVTPAVWLYNYTFLKAKPDLVDVGFTRQVSYQQVHQRQWGY